MTVTWISRHLIFLEEVFNVAELVDATARVRKYGARCTSKPGGTLALYKTLIPGSNPGVGTNFVDDVEWVDSID